jgi:apolipoprotein N-acyltransferase
MLNAALALFGGLMMRWSFSLHPVWWLAWLAPAPLLVAALRSSTRAALGWSLLAGAVAASADLHYHTLVMPLAAALFVTLLLALLWVLVVSQARRVMLASSSAWTVLAYPLMWCAVDTLLAHLHPDGNFDSIA